MHQEEASHRCQALLPIRSCRSLDHQAIVLTLLMEHLAPLLLEESSILHLRHVNSDDIIHQARADTPIVTSGHPASLFTLERTPDIIHIALVMLGYARKAPSVHRRHSADALLRPNRVHDGFRVIFVHKRHPRHIHRCVCFSPRSNSRTPLLHAQRSSEIPSLLDGFDGRDRTRLDDEEGSEVCSVRRDDEEDDERPRDGVYFSQRRDGLKASGAGEVGSSQKHTLTDT
mmetsp:Transcript_42276/g.105661  ORF Transcript_42276/g.105661 Transcript_42276/m.105661 type:complete len:229 (-) Transcript_42276:838-1524(-)